jgi:hypothetical protein
VTNLNDANLITVVSLAGRDERHYLHRWETTSCNFIRPTLQNYDDNTATQLQYNASIASPLNIRNSHYGTAMKSLFLLRKLISVYQFLVHQSKQCYELFNDRTSLCTLVISMQLNISTVQSHVLLWVSRVLVSTN